MAEESLEIAAELESDGEIDSLSNLEDAPVYIVSLLDDEVVWPSHQEV